MMLCGVSVVFKSLGDVFHDLRRRAQTVLPKWYGPRYAFCFGEGTVPRGTVLGTVAQIAVGVHWVAGRIKPLRPLPHRGRNWAYRTGAVRGATANLSGGQSLAYIINRPAPIPLSCFLGDDEVAEIGSLLRGAFRPEDEKLASILSRVRAVCLAGLEM